MSSVFNKHFNIKLFLKALSWIEEHQDQIEKDIRSGECGDSFDYPDYWGLPTEISNKLGSEEVDCIQQLTAEFADEMWEYLCNTEEVESGEKNE